MFVFKLSWGFFWFSSLQLFEFFLFLVCTGIPQVALSLGAYFTGMSPCCPACCIDGEKREYWMKILISDTYIPYFPKSRLEKGGARKTLLLSRAPELNWWWKIQNWTWWEHPKSETYWEPPDFGYSHEVGFYAFLDLKVTLKVNWHWIWNLSCLLVFFAIFILLMED